MKCVICNNETNELEQALTKKLINRGLTDSLCLDCLSDKFQVDKELLIEKALYFQKSGCLLFKDIAINEKV